MTQQQATDYDIWILGTLINLILRKPDKLLGPDQVTHQHD